VNGKKQRALLARAFAQANEDAFTILFTITEIIYGKTFTTSLGSGLWQMVY
jgi:hypothetical protein